MLVMIVKQPTTKEHTQRTWTPDEGVEEGVQSLTLKQDKDWQKKGSDDDDVDT